MKNLFPDNAVGKPPASTDHKTLVELSPDVICTISADGNFVYVNPASHSLWGYKPEELMGRPVSDFLSPEDLAQAMPTLAELHTGSTARKYETLFRRRDGSMQPTLWSVNWSAEHRAYYCVARDGSVKWQIRKKAQQSEERLTYAYQLARVAWWERRAGEKSITASEELYQMYGISRRQYPAFTRDVYLSLVHPEDLELAEQMCPDRVETDSYQYCHRLLKPTGEVIHINNHVQLRRNEAGEMLEVIGTTTDVTALKQYEEELKETQKKYYSILETLGDGFFMIGRDWKVTYWNGKAEKITGIPREWIIGKDFLEVYPLAKGNQFKAGFAKAIETGEPVHFVEYALTYDAWMEVGAYPNDDGLAIYVRDVTAVMKQKEEKRKLAQQLSEANHRLMNVLENMSDGFYTLDSNWNITFANERIAGMLGLDKNDYLGKNFWECFPEMVNTRPFQEYHRAVRENTLVSYEEYNSRFDMWFEINAYPDAGGLSVYVKDITQRKKQEKELQRSNERFEFAAKATSEVIWDQDVVNGCLYVNPRFTSVFGHVIPAETNCMRALWVNHIHPADRERVLQSLAAAFSDASVTMMHNDYRFYKANGEMAYVTDRAFILRNEKGEAVRAIGAIKDITERKTQRMKLEFLSRATSEVIWQRQVDSEMAEINGERFTELFGYEVGDKISLAFWKEKLHPDDLKVLIENFEWTVEQGLPSFIQEYRFKKADGSWAYVKDRTLLLRDENGRVSTILSALEDVTRERLAERALYESRENYLQLFNSSPLPALVIEPETLAILDVNQKTVEHYGYSREEFLTMTVFQLRPRKQYRNLKKRMEKLNESSFAVWYATHVTRKGEEIKVEISNRLIQYRGRKLILSVVNDITHRLRLEQALLEAQQNHHKSLTKATIEAQEKERSHIGKELHDNVNQILTSAKLYLENSKYIPEKAEFFLGKGISFIHDSINEIRRLSKELITPTLSDVGFKETIEELVDSYMQLNLFGVRCRYKVDERTIPQGVQLTLYRILQEAFNNTVKYADASAVTVVLLERGSDICMRFKDNGKGFDVKNVKSGLGLQNIRNRVEAYHGQVLIDSKPGKGTLLTVVLPMGAG